MTTLSPSSDDDGAEAESGLYAVWAVMSWGSLKLTTESACAGQMLTMTGPDAPVGFVPVFSTREAAEAFRNGAGPKVQTADITTLTRMG